MVAPKPFLYACHWLHFALSTCRTKSYTIALCGYLFSIPEVLLSGAYAELVVSLKPLLSEWHLFCDPEIYLSGAYHGYRCIDIVFDYASNRTTFVLCILHLIHIYIDIDTAYLIVCMHFAILSVYL